MWNRAKDDPEGFWGEQAQHCSLGQALGHGARLAAAVCQVVCRGQLNASYNCVDRHCEGAGQEQGRDHLGRRARRSAGAAYQDLLREVSKFANVLKGLGVKKGDVVAIYMPMIPELVIALWPVPGSGRRTR